MKSRSSARGVSLVELLTVVAIVGLMVAISVPSLHRLSRRREPRVATAEPRAIAREVCSRAVARGGGGAVKLREIADIVTPDALPVRSNRSTTRSFSPVGGGAAPGSMCLTGGARGVAEVVVYGVTGSVQVKMPAGASR